MRHRHLLASIGVLWSMLSGTVNGQDCDEEVSDQWRIELRNRTIRPCDNTVDAQLERGLVDATQHALIQLRRPLTADMRRQLFDEMGIRLLKHNQATTYVGLVGRQGLAEFRAQSPSGPVRWMGAFRPEDKIEPSLLRGEHGSATQGDDGKLTLTVVFHSEDVEADEILDRFTNEYERHGVGSSWRVRIFQNQLRNLAQDDGVRAIDPAPLPFIPQNDSSRMLAGVDDVHQVTIPSVGLPDYQGVTGEGVTVAVMDSGVDGDHSDFQGRLTSVGTPTDPRHGTHVAGVIGASGYRSEDSVLSGSGRYLWRGMAPKGALLSFVVEDMGGAVETYSQVVNELGAHVINSSYVQSCIGYDVRAETIDSVVRGSAVSEAGLPIPPRGAVWSVGNAGNAVEAYCLKEYPTLGLFGYFGVLAPAKNPIVVGAVNSPDGRRWFRSSLGPTLDGRIKPDVVAAGDRRIAPQLIRGELDCTPHSGEQTAIVSTSSYVPDDYEAMEGSSMAAAAVTGVIALILEKWLETFGGDEMCGRQGEGLCLPLPSTLKGILVQTAVDLSDKRSPACEAVDSLPSADLNPPVPIGYSDGPDYATGYGLVNAEAALQTVAVGPGAARQIIEAEISATGLVHKYVVDVPTAAERLRVTLAWDDEPGDSAVAKTAPKLVNDLDLALIEPKQEVVHLPWVLHPGDASNWPKPNDTFRPVFPGLGYDEISPTDVPTAVRGHDRRNNVEQVEVTAANKGKWTITVTAHHLPGLQLPQKYSLVSDYPISPFAQQD